MASPPEEGGTEALGVAGRDRWEGEASPCEGGGVWDWERCALAFLAIYIAHHTCNK